VRLLFIFFSSLFSALLCLFFSHAHVFFRMARRARRRPSPYSILK
jgi:hypothetical protein